VRAAIYCRVSTPDQVTENQERELRAVAARMGHDVVEVYRDHGVSGARGRDARPAFDAMCRAMTRREFDLVMAWSVDRLSRSLEDLVRFLNEVHSCGADLFLYAQGLDTRTPTGRAMFQMLGIFSELERAIIQERIRAGIARARASGVHCGRRPTDPELVRSILEALESPEKPSLREVARRHGVSVGTVVNVRERAKHAQG
jgi:DNA invertase Pin-like site-specific DNA recombinase